MSSLSPTVDPPAVGIDPARVERIDAVVHAYVDRGLFPGTQLLLTRRGEIVHHDVYGFADLESGRPLREDAIFRIYSMTKPITSVALMTLYERGQVLLEEPIGKYLPALDDLQVWAAGDATNLQTRAADRQVTVKDLLTHTAGLTYGFQHQHPLDAMYRDAELGDFGLLPDFDNAGMVERLGAMPLLFSPGTAWNYSMATDVIGALIEVISGLTLDEFFQREIFGPLGMVDTGFWIDDDRTDRLGTCYGLAPEGRIVIDVPETSPYRQRQKFLTGGGGLVSTMADYHRFTTMLLRGGEFDGVRILSPRTVAFMTENHLPRGQALTDVFHQGFAETVTDGVGFGLGFRVNLDPAANAGLGSKGDYGWGGAASTHFSIDPLEELTLVFLTQLLPSSSNPIRRHLQATVYQALVD